MAIRKLRVVFSDPDATDSSSGEEEEEDHDDEIERGRRGENRKRVVYEIPMRSKTLDVEKKKKKKGLGNRSSAYRGVRRRSSGRWVAEIRDPIRRVRCWLGTYGSAEAAAEAYRAAGERFRAEQKIGGAGASVAAASPSSVLDTSAADRRDPPPEAEEEGRRRSIAELFEKRELEIPEMEFGAMGAEEEGFLWGELCGELLIGLDDLPLLDQQLDGCDFSFLDTLDASR